MPRTRGQEVALQERGLPTTPPQQLSTPRRAQKPKVGNRKTKQPVAVSSDASLLPQSKSGIIQTKSTSASQIDTQVLKPVCSAVQKRGRKAKPISKKVAQSTDEEVISEEAQESKATQELSENSNSQAVQLAPREIPKVSSVTPISSSPTINPQTPFSSSGTVQSPEKISSITKEEVEACPKAPSQDGITHVEPSQLETDSNLPPCENIQEHKLMEIILNLIPAFIALLKKHPDIEGNAILERLLTEGELQVTMKSLEKNEARVSPRPEEQTHHIIDDVSKSPRQTPQTGSRYLLKRKMDETEQGDTEDAASKRLRTNSRHTKRVPQLFDENGMLTLTAYKEVPITQGSSLQDEISDNEVQHSHGAPSQSRRRPMRSPMTPQPRGWALSGFLPSAQTVSRFLPSFSRRTPIVSSLPITPSSNATDVSQTDNFPLSAQHNGQGSVPEPRSVTSDGKKDEGHKENRRNTRRHRHPKSKHALKANNEKEEIRKRDEMIASLQAQLEAQKKGEAQNQADQAKSATLREKATQADNATPVEQISSAQSKVNPQIEARHQITANKGTGQTPKSILKRKTASPNVIPNPPGGGFGLNLEYFGQDSDSDDDSVGTADPPESPSGPPNKKIRLSGEPAPLYIGDRFRATPYLGKELALPPLPSETSHPRSTFLETNLDVECQTPAATPPHGPTVTIKVPSPSDSDSEWDGTSYVDIADDPPVAPLALTSALTRVEDAQSSGLNATEEQRVSDTTLPQKQSPYENPNVNPAFDFCGSLSRPKTAIELAFPNTWTYPAPSQPQPPSIIGSPNLALDKARQSALKHKPQQPSRLRETARFSTSTVGTEVGDNEAKAENQVTKSNELKVKPGKPASNETGRDQNERVNKEAYKSSFAKGNVFDHAQPLQDPEARDPYTGRVMRESPRDPMLLEPVSISHEPVPGIDQSPELSGEISTDTITSEEDDSDNLPVFDSYAKADYRVTARVRKQLHDEYGNDQRLRKTETAPAPELQNEARADFDDHVDMYFQSQKEQVEKFLGHKTKTSEINTIPKTVNDEMDTGWEETDKEAAVEKFDTEFEDYLEQPT